MNDTLNLETAADLLLYPTEIEAMDGEMLMFKLNAFDDCTAQLEMHGMIGPGNVDAICAAIKTGIEMLRLKGEAT